MPRNSAAYDEDFYAWTQEQATLLRSGEFSQVDIENVAEELESMGRSDKREIDSRLEVLLMHLLKWQVQVRFQIAELVWYDSRAAKPDRRPAERVRRVCDR